MVGLVVGIVALEPHHLAVALEGDDVGGQAVQEPPVMADRHHTAGEGNQCVLQRPQGFHVQIIGGLVQKQHVGARH